MQQGPHLVRVATFWIAGVMIVNLFMQLFWYSFSLVHLFGTHPDLDGPVWQVCKMSFPFPLSVIE